MTKKEGTIEKLAWHEKLSKEELKGLISEEKKKFEKTSDIHLALNEYDDIFSDFDPRPSSERALSDDFLMEAKRASEGKITKQIDLKFSMPIKKRNLQEETIIKKRLKEYFQHHSKDKKKEVNSLIMRGILFIIIGIALMILATWILFNHSESLSLLGNFAVILLEPAGWFFIWEGFTFIVIDRKEKMPDLEFLEKMASARISFKSK